jgi:hypothetical protein
MVDVALTMSVSPSYSHGAPSLAEVLITRTFAKPTNPFVDGEFLKALEHADDGEAPATAPPTPTQAGGDAAPQDNHSGHPPSTSGTRIDVRA